jgi:two-component system, cell cycle sensor histidine kinase and response regulator CckA
MSPVNTSTKEIKDVKRIMVVEDEAIVRNDLVEFILDLGYEVVASADTGEDAVDKARASEPDLIFMDINLKGEMDGIAAAEIISENASVPIIFLTAFSDQQTRDRVKQTTPYGYILKPFDERELQTGIEIALRRHQFEKELAASRNWYSTTLNSIGDAVVTTDNEGKITFVNTVAENLLGISSELLIGCRATEYLNLISENGENTVENPILVVLKSHQVAGLPPNTNLVRRDGKILPIDDSTAPVVNEKAETLGAVMVFRDSTERRELINQLVEAKRMEAVGILAGGLAHNFNNMLTAVQLNLELALRSTTDYTLAKRIVNAKEASEKAAELTRQLLLYAKGQFLHPKIVFLNDVIKNIKGLCDALARNGVEIEIDLNEAVGAINVDVSHLEQAILNLVNNSVAALTDSGKVVISTDCQIIEGEKKDFTGKTIMSSEYYRVTVSDNGTGMDAQTLANAFLPFFTTKETKGMGLGLSAVSGFVQQSNGFLEVESAVGVGTRISLLFSPAEFVI